MRKRTYSSDHILYYFARERFFLVLILLTGTIYNAGMACVPWFEGQLAQYLCDIIGGSRKSGEMLLPALVYLFLVLVLQSARFLKRLFVRKFANRIGKNMKLSIYQNILAHVKTGESNSKIGSLMTRAISDAEACAEGMRKFTTEIFDTGVLLVCYLLFLLWYDWRLTLLSVVFVPVAYLIASRMKTVVTRNTAAFKESMGQLNSSTLERVDNALTYRVYGLENQRNAAYETVLQDYERKAVLANIWESSMQPLYQTIALLGVVPILYFGGRNVLGIGWKVWDIAAFSAFLSCFNRVALKASKSAKLFNAVQKAVVSWDRIKEYLKPVPEKTIAEIPGEAEPWDGSQAEKKGLVLKDVSFAYPGHAPLIRDLNLRILPGEIVGVTGQVACGKTSLGKLLINEREGSGSITYYGEDYRKLLNMHAPLVAYVGHALELFHGSIEENICMGVPGDVMQVLKIVCMDEEVAAFPEGVRTLIGDGGIRLSGGQQARIALARAIYHGRPVLILDDPFAAVDQKTELQIFENIRAACPERMILLISHRLVLFPQLDRIVFLDEGNTIVSDHNSLYLENASYQELYHMQTGGEAS